MLSIAINLLLLAVAIFVIAEVLPGIKHEGFGSIVKVAIVYSVIHWLLSGFLFWLTLPFVLITLGLFTFVINAFLLWITDKILDDFEIEGFGALFLASLLITLCNVVLNWIFR